VNIEGVFVVFFLTSGAGNCFNKKTEIFMLFSDTKVGL